MNPTRSSLGGTAVLMACACGASSSAAKLAVLAGLGATAALVHPIFITVGAALVLHGLWHTRRRSAGLALVAFAVLAIAAFLTPPSEMTVKGDGMQHGTMGLPWSAPQMLGAVLYLAAGAVIARAFWLAFPSPKPGAAGTAMGGMALAAGCTACCGVTGAVAGMAVTFGITAPYVETLPVVFWTGVATVALGLYRLGGWRPAALAVLGGLVTPAGKVAYKLLPAALDLSGRWKVGTVDLVFIPKYFTYLGGAAMILGAFALAYRLAAQTAIERAPMAHAMVPEATGGD